jgi:hypothetical protein
LRKIIHVHQQEIRHKDPKNHPAIIVRTYKGSKHFETVEVMGPSTLHHSPEPDSCGARVWIETNAQVVGTNQSGKEVFV